MDEHPHLRLVHDKSAPPGDTPARPKARRPRRRRKVSAEPFDPVRPTTELAASRRRIRELERQSLRDNHIICAAVFVMSCAYFGFIVWQRVAAMP